MFIGDGDSMAQFLKTLQQKEDALAGYIQKLEVWNKKMTESDAMAQRRRWRIKLKRALKKILR